MILHSNIAARIGFASGVPEDSGEDEGLKD
jgi:hypothetical protein